MADLEKARKAKFLGYLCLGTAILVLLAGIFLGVRTGETVAFAVPIPVGMMLMVIGILALNVAKRNGGPAG